jgi:hypothetical protein
MYQYIVGVSKKTEQWKKLIKPIKILKKPVGSVTIL